MPERNRGYLRKQRLRNIERRKKLISQRELMYLKTVKCIIKKHLKTLEKD